MLKALRNNPDKLYDWLLFDECTMLRRGCNVYLLFHLSLLW